MSNTARHPILTLALAGFLLGLLGESDWYVMYAGMLFGFAVVIGLKRPPRMMRWLLVLATGTPVAHLCSVLTGWSAAGDHWAAEAMMRTGAALTAILPGVGAGLLYRRLAPRITQARS